MNLRVYRPGYPNDDYYDTEADWDFRFTVENNGTLKIFKMFHIIGTAPLLVASYAPEAWDKVADVSLT